MIWTFIVVFSAAHRMASSALESGNVLVMYFSTRSPRSLAIEVFSSFNSNNSSARSMGPQRLPTTLSSSITKGAALNSFPAAHVLFRI